jgi:hypothetical protein
MQTSRLRSVWTSRVALLMLMMMLTFALTTPTFAQEATPETNASDNTSDIGGVSDVIRMDVDAGYDGRYRENHWLPLRVTVRNDGTAITGELVVRPETSGRVVSNAFSTPIDLPAGSEKTALLYIQARRLPPRVTVELLNSDGERLAERDASILSVDPYDKMHVIVAGALADTLNLQSVVSGGRDAFQARWTVEQIPPLPEALTAIDLIILNNIDSEAFTLGQIEALEEYVLRGGHLIVAGGSNWQSTTSAITSLLPMMPNASLSVNDVSALADFAGRPNADLRERNVITTGDVRDDATILVRDGDDNPLLVRWERGAGVVDFLTVDPTLEPLRSWSGLPELWRNVLATRPAMAGWVRGIVDYNEAAIAVAVLPGIELLPSVTSMLVYIALYVLLIGPVNYIVLSRFNRRGWAWVTIPLLIVVFSVQSWTVGFNLRGNEVIMSRLSVVQSWQGEDDAMLTELVGILSPRRETYALNNDTDDDATRPLRVMPALEQTGILAQNITQSTSTILQTTDFSAQDITVDGGIFANFSVMGRTASPDIGGSLTLRYGDSGLQTLQGAIRNDSDDITLEDAVILARGVAYRLNEPFAPDDLITLDEDDLTLMSHERFATASPFEYSYTLPSDLLFSARDYLRTQANLQTANEILGIATNVRRRETLGDSPQAQETARREALLKSIVRDQYSSTARGNTAYLVGWTQTTNDDIRIENATWQDVTTTLYIIELDVTVDTSDAPQDVVINGDQFTWTALLRDGIEGAGPDDMILTQGATGDFRFVPQTGSVLSEVDSLIINIDRTSSYGRDVVLWLWNWETGEWRTYGDGTPQTYTIDDPEPFLGANNMVDVRVTFDGELGSVRMRGLSIEQRGQF